MAVRKFRPDYTNIQQARANNSQANHQLVQARQQAIEMDSNSKQLSDYNDYLDKQSGYNTANFVLNLSNQLISGASQLYNIVKQDQQQKGSSLMTQSFQEGSRLFTESLYDGSSYFEKDENGNGRFVISQKVLDWKESARQQIENGNYGLAKEELLASFDTNWESFKTNAFGQAIEQSYADLNTAFVSNLKQSKIADVQQYVLAGGNLDTLSQGAQFAGVMTISSRTDWSENKKNAEIASYMLDVQAEGDKQIVVNTALQQGLDQANNLIRSERFSYLSETEKQSLYNSASTAVQQKIQSVNGMGKSVMDDAIMSEDMVAEDAYKALEQNLQGYGKDIRDAVMDEAKEEHKKLALNAINNSLAQDKMNGLSALEQRYDGLTNGSHDAWFYNIPELQTTAEELYYNAITSAKEDLSQELSTSVSNIDKINKELIENYEKTKNIIIQGFDNGEYNGETAFTLFAANASQTISSLQEGGYTNTSTLSAEIITSVKSQFDSMLNNYVPAKFKDEYDAGLNIAFAAFNLNKTNGLSVEESAHKLAITTEYAGRIADYIFTNGANMNGEEFTNICTGIAKDIALSHTASAISKKNAVNGSFINDDTAAAIKKNYLNQTQFLTSEEGIGMGFVRVNKLAGKSYDLDGKEGAEIAYPNQGIVFKSSEASEAFDSLARYENNQLSYMFASENIESIAIPGYRDGNLTLVPDIQVIGDTTYRFDGEDILFLDSDGKFKKTGFQVSTTAEKMSQNKPTEVFLNFKEYIAEMKQQEALTLNQAEPVYYPPEEWMAKKGPENQSLYVDAPENYHEIVTISPSSSNTGNKEKTKQRTSRDEPFKQEELKGGNLRPATMVSR